MVNREKQTVSQLTSEGGTGFKILVNSCIGTIDRIGMKAGRKSCSRIPGEGGVPAITYYKSAGEGNALSLELRLRWFLPFHSVQLNHLLSHDCG